MKKKEETPRPLISLDVFTHRHRTQPHREGRELFLLCSAHSFSAFVGALSACFLRCSSLQMEERETVVCELVPSVAWLVLGVAAGRGGAGARAADACDAPWPWAQPKMGVRGRAAACTSSPALPKQPLHLHCTPCPGTPRLAGCESVMILLYVPVTPSPRNGILVCYIWNFGTCIHTYTR